MSAKDYYKILGVSENASADEIKKVYRRLAKEYHPDANQGDKQSEERFKDISEAYEILKDPQKRQKYDQLRRFGAGGFDFNGTRFGGFRPGPGAGRPGQSSFEGFDIFGNLGDVLSQFFDFGENIRQKKYSPRKGEDIYVKVDIPFELSMTGGKTSFSIDKEKTCPVCQGGGAKPGSRVQTCSHCQGRGTVVFGQGGFGVSRPCPKCYGRGQVIKNPCDRCHGSGKVTGKRTYNIKVPAVIENGGQIRLKGEGKPGIGQKPAGDLIVKFRVKGHHFFTREGNDIHCRVKLGLAQAVRGALVLVKTIHGKKIKLKVPPGTLNNAKFKLPGLGVSKNGVRGNQIVTVQVDIPDKPTEEEKDLIYKYTKTQRENHS